VPAGLKALPFADRNDRDFEEMTARIRQGLESIRKNRSLDPTQVTLAKLAQCSRRTLSLRIWPIEELRRIKESRPRYEQQPPSDAAISVSKFHQCLLEKQVKNYQRQNGELFDRVQDLEEEKSRSALALSTLENERDVLKEEVERLEKQLRRSKLRPL
jgi:hypothetical protein